VEGVFEIANGILDDLDDPVIEVAWTIVSLVGVIADSVALPSEIGTSPRGRGRRL
jgi:hypothetical protein